MGQKRKKLYEAILDGATDGHSGAILYDYVKSRCPDASSRQIVRASLLALTDPLVSDRNILEVIYALAIRHRMDELHPNELANEVAYTSKRAPSLAEIMHDVPTDAAKSRK
ncbi:hypothetical protein [Oryzifoliimicrobium ureilyticus]|uniref:hypothetical protein n=1 Tax=Oryzifoliimicrobium ureilyticus TaxID=3113724 RepID=UPI00307609A0